MRWQLNVWFENTMSAAAKIQEKGISESASAVFPCPRATLPPFATPRRRGRANYAAGQRAAFGGLFPH